MIAQPFASRRAILLGLLLALLSAVGGCQRSNTYHFSVDFKYPSRGIGPHQYLGFVTLEPGKEDQVVRQALITALQDMEFSARSLFGSAGGRAEGKDCETEGPIKLTTDIVPLPASLVADYNAELGRGAMRLSAGVIYGLQYKIAYGIENEQLNFSVCSFLYHKSWGAGEFRPYKKDYSSRFFGTLLNTHLVSALRGRK